MPRIFDSVVHYAWKLTFGIIVRDNDNYFYRENFS